MNFNLASALESADDVPVVEQDKTTELGIEEAALAENQSITDAGNTFDRLVTGSDDVQALGSEVEETLAHESEGLSPSAARILKTAITRIVGKAYANSKLPAHESYERGNRVEATHIALEGINQTIKDFWAAIKKAFSDFWNNTKSWYIKQFDVSNKLIARAKDIEAKSNTLSGAAKEKSFEMSGVKNISVNYSVKTPDELIKGLGELATYINGNIDTFTKSNASNKAEKLIDNFSKILVETRTNATNASTTAGADAGKESIKAYIAAISADRSAGDDLKPKPDLTIKMQNTDPRFNPLANGKPVEILMSNPLPGNKTVYETVYTVAETDPNFDPLEGLNSFRRTLGNSAEKPKEMDDNATFQTLNTSQLSTIAGYVLTIGETSLKYKQEFEAYDRYKNTLDKKLDELMKELETTEVAQPAPAATPPANGQQPPATPSTIDANKTVDKFVQAFAKSVLSSERRRVSFQGAMITHATTVSTTFLNYCDRSLAQYS